MFLHATNVHQGGGRALLGALMESLHDNVKFLLSLDERMPIPLSVGQNVHIKHVKPTVVQRLRAERWLAQCVTPDDIVLCFGNLPPLFKLRGQVVVFVQNRYLIEDVNLSGFPLNVRLRLVIERLWLLRKISNVSEFVVQTPTMKRLLELKTRGKVPVRVLPFVAEPSGYARNLPQLMGHKEVVFDYVYVASGEPHKNHRRLLEAWCLLAEEGFFPSLCLTLDKVRFAGLCQEINTLCQRYGLKVINVGGLSHQDVLVLYTKSGAAIYPSKFESFGLPLIEAMQANLPVLASELDYVRDVLDPDQTFNPDSPVSIAKAVKRFMGIDEHLLPLLDATRFMSEILDSYRRER